ncbi:MAG: hypothetical protein AAF518_04700, partial [Spirochaetota bacterium]
FVQSVLINNQQDQQKEIHVSIPVEELTMSSLRPSGGEENKVYLRVFGILESPILKTEKNIGQTLSITVNAIAIF